MRTFITDIHRLILLGTLNQKWCGVWDMKSASGKQKYAYTILTAKSQTKENHLVEMVTETLDVNM
jgi:hypothetical protein